MIYLHLKIKFNQLKNNEAMFKFNLHSTVGLPFAKARLRGLVHS
ncbi:hypothetical protein SAMN05421857_3874 [Chryseobacterium formosense]|nr:hypothetical protein SAMN05421857_3874 [Chryseobacterium formosense]